MKRLYFLLPFIIFFSIAIADEAKINLMYFDSDSKYAPGSGVSVVINPTGVFDRDNTFTLELVDSNDQVVVTLASVQEFYVPVINGVIPSSTAVGTYKLRISSSSSTDIVFSDDFSIIEGQPSSIPEIESNIDIAYQGHINCINDVGLLAFGKLCISENETTIAIAEQDRLIKFTDAYVDENANELFIVNVNTGRKEKLISQEGDYFIPSDLTFGSYVVEAKRKNGNVSSIKSALFLFFGNATAISNTTQENVCVGSTVEFKVDCTTSAIGRNYPNSLYKFVYGDGSSEEVMHSQLLENPVMTHVYSSVSCKSGGFFNFSLQLSNKGNFLWNDTAECDEWHENGNGVDKRINASLAPVAGFEMNSIQCVDLPIEAKNTTVLGAYGNPVCLNEPKYTWQYKSPEMSGFKYADKSWIDSEGNLTIPAKIVKIPGCWYVLLKASNKGGGCTNETTDEHMIMVEPHLRPSFIQSPDTICKGEIVIEKNKTPYTDCERPDWLWDVTQNDISTSTVSISPKKTAKDVNIQFNEIGKYEVKMTAHNTCGYFNATDSVVVVEDAKVEMSKKESSVCILPSASDVTKTERELVLDFSQEEIRPKYSKDPNEPKSYKWTVTGGAYEFLTRDDVPYPTIKVNEFGSYKIKVEIGGKCKGKNSATYTYNVYQIPILDTSGWGQSICSDDFSNKVVLKEKNSLAGTTYSWSVQKDNNISCVSCDKTGKSDIPAVKFHNDNSICGDAQYTVTPTTQYCTGESSVYEIKVKPRPYIDIKNIYVCSGDDFKVDMDAKDIVPQGTTFSWPKPSFEDGKIEDAVASDGQKNVISGNLINKTNVTQTVTYTITASSPDLCDYGNNGCSNTFTLHVYVKPVPSIKDKETEICTKTSFNVKPINDSENLVPAGTKYTWTVEPSAVIGGENNPNVPSDIINGTLENPTNTVQPAIYHVTPVVDGCVGASFKLIVNVKPGVYVTPQTTIICSGDDVPELSWSGVNVIPEGVTYSWSAPVVDGITGQTAGVKQTKFSQGVLINSTSSPIDITYLLKPDWECDAPEFKVVVTVNPTPNINSLTKEICSREDFEFQITDKVDGVVPANTTYKWDAPVVTGGIAGGASGDGTLITGNLNNPTNVSQTATYTILPKTSDGCVGSTFPLVVKVNPEAKNITVDDISICNGNEFVVTLENGKNGLIPNETTYSWDKPVVSAGITGGASGSGDKIKGTLYNSTNTIQTATYTVTPKSGSCIGVAFTLRVNVIPSVTGDIEKDAVVCVNSGNPPVVTFTGRYGTSPYVFTYTINGGEKKMVTTDNGDSSVSVPVDVSSLGFQKYNLILVSAGSGAGCEGIVDKSASINVVPEPVVTISQATKQTICIGGMPGLLTANIQNALDVMEYQWYLDDALIQGQNGKTYQPEALMTEGTYTYKVIALFQNESCKQQEALYKVEVVKDPEIESSELFEQTLCQDAPASAWSVSVGDIVGTATYQWYRDGQRIDGATSSTYTPQTNIVGDFTYYCEIRSKNEQGEDLGCDVRSGNAILHVTSGPSITVQPQSETLCKDGLAKMMMVNYTNGVGIPQYQWYKDGVEISGATEQSYRPETGSVGTFMYKCVLTFAGGCQSLNSEEAKLDVKSQSVSSITPDQEQEFCTGGTAQALTVNYTGGNGTPRYQWYRNDQEISGATDKTYQPTDIIEVKDYKYKVKVSFSDASCQSATSSEVTIKVVKDPEIESSELFEQTLCQDAPASAWSVTVGDIVGTATYQWYKDGQKIDGATSSTYTPLTNVVGDFTYYCEVRSKNSEGEDLGCDVRSANASLHVIPGPSITVQPQSETLCKDGVAKLMTVNYTNGVGTPQYQWYKDGVEIVGATEQSYQPETNIVGSFGYKCVLTFAGGCQSLNSEEAKLDVKSQAVSSVTPDQEQEFCTGGTAKELTVNYTGGNGTPSYQWYRNDQEIFGATSKTYHPTDITEVKDYKYRVKVSFSDASCQSATSSEVTIKVVKGPELYDVSLDEQSVCKDEETTEWSVNVKGGAGTYKYQWYKDGLKVDGATKSSILPSSKDAGVFRYYCHVITVGDNGEDLGCEVKSEVAVIKVGTLPEVSAIKALQDSCVNMPIDMKDYFKINWTEPAIDNSATWIVKDKSGREIFNETIKTNEYPIFTFDNAGEYIISVDVKNGFDCNSGSVIHLEDNITIYDATYELKFKQEQEEICEGGTVIIENMTDQYSNISYEWSVDTPNDGALISDPNDRQPTFTFNKYGNFTIRVKTHNQCYSKDVTFSVEVHKDPTVSIKAVDKYCIDASAPLDMKNIVEYTLYGMPEEEQHPTWTVIPSDGVTIETDNSLYPKIYFTESGIYEIKVVTSSYGCNAQPASSSIVVPVYADFDLNIEDTANPNLCYGDAFIQIVNNTIEDPTIKYIWSATKNGEQTSEVNFDAVDSKSPNVTFNGYGQYEVNVVATNNVCYEHTLPTPIKITVHRTPDVRLKDLSKSCTNSDVRIDDSHVEYNWYVESGLKPTWSVYDESGTTKITTGYQIDDETSETPTFRFLEEGNYTIRVDMPNIGCGSSTYSSKLIEIIRNDASIDVEALPQEVCVSDKIQIKNNTSDIYDFEYKWFVEPDSYIITGGDDSKSPIIEFTDNGTYVVSVEIKNICGTQSVTVGTIDVHRAPEIQKFIFPEKICTGAVIKTSEYASIVMYEPTNIKKFDWKITSDDGGTGGYDISDAASMYPDITFSKAGRYTISLDVSDGFDQCVGTRHAEVKVDVLDAQFELIVAPTLTEGCTPFKVNFENTSTGQELKYSWTVDNPGASFSDGKVDVPEPVLMVNDPGKYNVNVVAKNFCYEDNMNFVIKGRHDPEVLIKNIDSICPGGTIDFNSLVFYKWYNTPEEEQKVVWSVTPDDGTYSIDDRTSQTPKITFNKYGVYNVTASLTGFGCGNGILSATREVKVLDDDFNPLISLPDNEICVGTQLFFENNTDDNQGISYMWTGTPNDGWTFAPGYSNKSKEPVITLNTPDRYTFSVEVSNKCKTLNLSFNAKANQDPDVTIMPLDTICNSSKLVFDETNVIYDWHNSLESERNVHWYVTDTDNNEVEGVEIIPNSEARYPIISLKKPITYLIKAKVDGFGCNGSKLSDTQSIVAINSEFVLSLKADTAEGCVHFDVKILNTTDKNQGINYKWNIDPVQGWGYVDSKDNSYNPTFRFNKEGVYKLHLDAQNKCASQVMDTTIVAHTIVKYETTDVKDVCGEYLFDAQKMLKVIGDSTIIQEIEWSIDRADYEYKYLDSHSLRPKILLKPENGSYDANRKAKYTVSAKIKAICNETEVKSIIVIDEPVTLVLKDTTYLCPNIADERDMNPYQLSASPTGGQWTLKESAEFLHGDTFYPNAPGLYHFTYSIQLGSCSATDSIKIDVYPYPTMDIGPDIQVCSKDQEPRLLTGIPNDGVWSGNEVSRSDDGKYYFNPPVDPGSYKIVYTITDQYKCKNRDYKKAVVNPLPVVDFSPLKHCLPDPVLFQPRASIDENTFLFDYGDGSTGRNLEHLYKKVGAYPVKMIVTVNETGCKDSLTNKLLVEKFPDQKIFVEPYVGCSPFTPEIKPIYEYADTLDTKFTWNFGTYGVDHKETPDPVTFETSVKDATIPFTFTVSNFCGTSVDYDTIRVLAQPEADFVPSVTSGCSPVTVSFKNVSVGSQVDMHYTWDFGDGSSRTSDMFPSHTFISSMNQGVTYNVELVAANTCGASSVKKDIYVIPAIVKPQIISPSQTACVGQEVCFVDKTIELREHHEILTYKWDFGNGKISDNPKDLCTIYNDVGPYKVSLTISTSCGSVESDSLLIRLYDSPVFDLDVESIKCAKDSVVPVLTLKSDIKAVTWDFGDGYYSNKFNPKHAYSEAGVYGINVVATANNFGECKTSKFAKVDIKPLPDPEITPLEYSGCSPLLYDPVYSEQFYTKVDYMGNGYTVSDVSHTYENKSLDPYVYLTRFYFEDKYGCKSEKEGRVTVYPQPEAKFTISLIEKEMPEIVHLQNDSYGADECVWTLPYTGTVHVCSDTIEKFYNNDVKDLILDVSNRYGCIDKYVLPYHPLMKGLYFPNTFSPNGITEEVRTFNGIGIGLLEYELEIFDMYGNLLFRTTSLDSEGKPNEGWDGRDLRGNLMPQDVYTWKAKAIFIDGTTYPLGNSRGPSEVTLHRGSVLLLQK